MSESQHTPGPWTVDPGGLIVGAVHPRAENNDATGTTPLAFVSGYFGSALEANARLIAAAPDLLAALKLAYAAMNHMGDVLNEMDAVELEDEEKTAPAFEAARAAIRKAKGHE